MIIILNYILYDWIKRDPKDKTCTSPERRDSLGHRTPTLSETSLISSGCVTVLHSCRKDGIFNNEIY
jgi:hypothetical protein